MDVSMVLYCSSEQDVLIALSVSIPNTDRAISHPSLLNPYLA
jgi:hypothetical protein